MPLRFELDQPAGANIARMLGEQIRKADRALGDPSDLTASVHKGRKALKRSRGVLRLAKPGLAKADFKRLNWALRDCGRVLSDARDTAILNGALTALACHADIGRSSAVRELKWLIADLAPCEESIDGEAEAVAGARLLLKRVQPLIDDFEPDFIERDDIISGYFASYADGRTKFEAISSEDDDEAHHDLRKAAQYHWRQSAMLSPIHPSVMQIRVETARRVSQLLGADHDLSILIAFIRREGPAVCTKQQRKRLIAAARDRQRGLRKLFAAPAQRLYALPPAALAEAVDAYWTAAERERDLASHFPDDLRDDIDHTQSETGLDPARGTRGVDPSC